MSGSLGLSLVKIRKMLLKSCPCSKKHVSLHTRNNLVSKISNNVRVRALKFSVLILDNELNTCEPGRGPFGRGHFGPGQFSLVFVARTFSTGMCLVSVLVFSLMHKQFIFTRL